MVVGKRQKVKGQKRQLLAFFCLHLAMLLSWSQLWAQSATAVDTLSVEIWPDFDEASVLVLLTGELSHDTPLPATLIVPLPAAARLNAVARISADGFMSDDIPYSQSADAVTLTTPDPSFRVEYYHPYQTNDEQRDFSFIWTADFPVNQMNVSVQQPLSADTMTTSPASTATTTSQLDGLTYHNLPTQAVPAGQTYMASVNYRMASPLLTANRLQNQGSETTAVPPNWTLYLAAAGTALVSIAMFWQAYNNRQKKQQQVRPRKGGKASYCHNCGQHSHKGDQFCRQCGTVLK